MKKTRRKLKKTCPNCGNKMVKKGVAKSGNQVWFCPKCKTTNIFHRIDVKIKKWIRIYISFLMCWVSLTFKSFTRRTFDRQTSRFKNKTLYFNPIDKTYDQIILDGIKIDNEIYYLIASDGKYVIGWHKCKSERAKSWVEFLRKIPAPKYVVCDGQKGLMFAIELCWNQTKIQRCQFHVKLNCKQKLTSNPKTEMGKELKYISSLICQTDTPDKVDAWGDFLLSLGEKYETYLKTKTYQLNGKWEYTHRRDRSCYHQLVKLFKSGDLFRWVYEKRFKVCNTSNSLEGGVNSRIKDLIRRHRGADSLTKCKIVEVYLLTRFENYNFNDLCQRFV